MVKIGMLSHRGKQVQHLALVRRRVAHPIGRKHRQLQRPRNSQCSLIAPLLLALLVALHLDIHALSSENSHQPLHNSAPCLLAAARQRSGQRTFIPSGQAHQSRRVLLQILPGRGAFALRLLPQLELGHQLAKILIPRARLTQ